MPGGTPHDIGSPVYVRSGKETGMTNRTDRTLSKPICYVVIDPDRADSDVPIRRNPGPELARRQSSSSFQVRFSLAEATPPGGCGTAFDPAGYAQLRLAVDVIRDLHGYPQWLPHAAAAQRGLVALAGPGGPFNRVATELLHRLGARLDVRVYGPLVLHAAPDSQQHIGSLSDVQLFRLAEMVIQIGLTIEGAKVDRVPVGHPIAAGENPTPWRRPGHAGHTSNRRSRAVAAG
jgi:hypothetical protein